MNKTKTIVGIGILTAITAVLQVISMNVRFGVFSITLSLIAIIVGASLYGWKAGAWLGFVFGCITLADASAFFAINIPGTVITCLLKGTLAGLCAGLVYKLIESKNRLAAVIAAAIVCPVVNTGVFLLGCVVFFLDTVKEWGAAAGFDNVGTYMIVGFVGINFLVELGVNLVLSSAVATILNAVSPERKKAKA